MRVATPDDAHSIVELVWEFFLENKNPLQRFFCLDLIWVRAFLDEFLSSPDCICFIERDGVIMGRVVNTWFGPNLTADAFIWYVRRNKRGGLLAWRLLKAYTDEADKRGVRFLFYTMGNGTYRKQIEGLLARRGFQNYSENFLCHNLFRSSFPQS